MFNLLRLTVITAAVQRAAMNPIHATMLLLTFSLACALPIDTESFPENTADDDSTAEGSSMHESEDSSLPQNTETLDEDTSTPVDTHDSSTATSEITDGENESTNTDDSSATCTTDGNDP
jgi:hypothetical protein